MKLLAKYFGLFVLGVGFGSVMTIGFASYQMYVTYKIVD